MRDWTPLHAPLPFRARIGRRMEQAVRPVLLAAIAAALAAPALAQAQDPTGTWLTASGDTRVRIARCGGAYCGTIVSSTYRKDTNNADPAKRDRDIVGVQIIWDLRPGSDGFSGQLYNPQDGRTYAGKLKLTGPGSLNLSGCVLGGLFCRSQTWTRVN
jgi:uncharacterized protein (DUF2147 family)